MFRFNLSIFSIFKNAEVNTDTVPMFDSETGHRYTVPSFPSNAGKKPVNNSTVKNNTNNDSTVTHDYERATITRS